jgi:hypothetical protein
MNSEVFLETGHIKRQMERENLVLRKRITVTSVGRLFFLWKPMCVSQQMTPKSEVLVSDPPSFPSIVCCKLVIVFLQSCMTFIIQESVKWTKEGKEWNCHDLLTKDGHKQKMLLWYPRKKKEWTRHLNKEWNIRQKLSFLCHVVQHALLSAKAKEEKKRHLDLFWFH